VGAGANLWDSLVVGKVPQLAQFFLRTVANIQQLLSDHFFHDLHFQRAIH
jgi:hypothetical protein